MAMAAPGSMDLQDLIKSMNPTLQEDIFVWATIPHGSSTFDLAQAMTSAEMVYREEEGTTLVLTQAVADKLGVDYTFPCRKVTLNVHSSLEASGFIAAVATRLAKLKVGVNPVSGYYHDHLYVPVGKEDVVVKELRAMATAAE